MSVAGRRASQGYDYQDIIAVHWLIQLLHDENLASVQLEIIALPGESEKATVDDVVITFKDRSINFIQAKKNQPEHENWTLDDKTLKDELTKICEQLEKTTHSKIILYSRSPFGELQKLSEASLTLYPSYSVFQTQAPTTTLKPTLLKLAAIFQRTEEQSYELVKRINFGSYHSLDDWQTWNLSLLANKVTQPETALDVLFSFMRPYKTGFSHKTGITRLDVEQRFQQRGLILAPQYEEKIILDEFKQTSRIGRDYLRTIAKQKIKRLEQDKVIALLEQDTHSILIVDKPGSGKTCLLLDLADYIEQFTHWILLFIKGDWFSGIKSLEDLEQNGLPKDIVGKCARLSASKKIVVIIDSLDVLALNREHNTLKVFLTLIDRLKAIDNASIIAACRSFDLKYDALLRNTNWSAQVTIADFDFEKEVLPFLQSWHINDSDLTADLKNILCVPQYLRLFDLIANKVSVEKINTSFQLQETVIEEVIRKDNQLGESALDALQKMASYCVTNRSQDMPKLRFSNQSILPRLISQDILEDRQDKIAFTHQTLLDALMIRDAISNNQSLESFTLSFPPLPYIRPFVRSYFFYLRVHIPEQFSKQVREFLSNENVAYHLKRLVVESLAEIIPEDRDWVLLRWLFNNQPDLFRRFFWRTQNSIWFTVFIEKWLPMILYKHEHENWRFEFIDKIRIWINDFPVDVIGYYVDALQNNWVINSNILFIITNILAKFKHWEVIKVYELLTLLLSKNVDDDFLGEPLSKYVDATNNGDDILWRYITKDLKLTELSSQFDLKLNCQHDDFYKKDFLENRLFQSENLLNLALADLQKWNNLVYGDFLRQSSWRMTHHRRNIEPYDPINALIDGLEFALKCHAKNNTVWWKNNEPKLRVNTNDFVIYILIKCYFENISSNLESIEQLLQNSEIFLTPDFQYELGELMQAAYPQINETVQEINQQLILTLYDNYENKESHQHWTNQVIYYYLVWIPVIFRTEQTQQFIEKWQHIFGLGLPKPDIRASGGYVSSPIDIATLMNLSDTGLIKYLKHYNNHTSSHNHFDDFLTGGREQVRHVFEDACSRNPKKYLTLFSVLITDDLHIDYTLALLKGIASHLRYRFGNLNPSSEWKAIEPLPDGEKLAKTLLFIMERYQPIWKDNYAICRVLEACCDVLIDNDSLNNLTILLFKLTHSSNPLKENDRKNLAMTGLNSVRGVAAESAITLFNRLLENGIEPPELLSCILKRFARDEVIGVRTSILNRLAYTLYKKPELGWQLFDDIFREPQDYLWTYTHSCFYYQYYENFDKVKPYLERLIQESPNEAGEIWANIFSLAYLSNYFSEDELFFNLENINSEKAWEGAIHVFIANIDKKENNQACESALLRAISIKMLSKDRIRQIEFLFGDHKNKQHVVSQKLAIAFINAIDVEIKQHLSYFFDWLAIISINNPEEALKIAEELVNKFKNAETPCRIWWHTESLISGLDNILKEADESNDNNLIHRAIMLQDNFLQLGVSDIDKYIEKF